MVKNNVLPDDLIVEILLRLPVKCLMRFSCVCKAWYAVIKDPLFMAKHLDRTNARILIRHTGEYSFSMLSNETLHDVSTRIRAPIFRDLYHCLPLVFGPCNGILCLYSYHNGVALWNPTTREIKSLPRKTFRRRGFWNGLFPYMAFGHDPETNDYKVLRFFISNNSGSPGQAMELYTLSSDSWRQMDLAVPDLIFGANLINTYMNGRNHWLGYNVIIYFDMSDEVFGVIPLPTDYFRRHRGDIAVYNEMIALIFYPTKTKATEKRFDVWVMTEYGVKESWTRLFTIGPVSGVERPLGFWSSHGVFMESSSGELLLYHHFTQQFKNLGVSLARVPYSERNMKVIIYKESQVFLNGRHEEEEGIIRVP